MIGSAHRPDTSRPSMRTTGRAPAPATVSAPQVNTHTASTASNTVAIRSTGWARSTGTYTPPALTTAHHATTNSTHRSIATPTARSGPTPASISTRANRVDHSSSSRYDTSRAPSTTATASGSAATAAANNCGATPTGAATPAPDHPDSTRSRSPRSSNDTSPTTTDASATTASITRPNQLTNRSMVARSNKSVAYDTTPAAIGAPGSSVGTSLSWKSRSNLAVRVDTASGSTLTPSRRHLGAHIVLEDHGHLKQRMMRRGAHRVELLDQQLERHILVAVGIQRLLTHPLKHIAEPVRRIDTHPQHPRVDEEPDQIIERLHPTARRSACPSPRPHRPRPGATPPP